MTASPPPVPGLARRLAVAGVAAASYGAAVGAVHSPTFAARNLVKMPLLLVATACVSGAAYFVVARLFTRSLSLATLASHAAAVFGDVATLLGSLAPPMAFLALTVQKPDEGGLHEYPLFLILNVVAIALTSASALATRTRRLADVGLSPSRAIPMLAAWSLVSLLVGSQFGWFLRPFFGVSTVDAPFMLGTEPDFRGDRSFFEAFAHAASDVVRGPRGPGE